MKPASASASWATSVKPARALGCTAARRAALAGRAGRKAARAAGLLRQGSQGAAGRGGCVRGMGASAPWRPRCPPGRVHPAPGASSAAPDGRLLLHGRGGAGQRRRSAGEGDCGHPCVLVVKRGGCRGRRGGSPPPFQRELALIPSTWAASPPCPISLAVHLGAQCIAHRSPRGRRREAGEPRRWVAAAWCVRRPCPAPRPAHRPQQLLWSRCRRRGSSHGLGRRGAVPAVLHGAGRDGPRHPVLRMRMCVPESGAGGRGRARACTRGRRRRAAAAAAASHERSRPGPLHRAVPARPRSRPALSPAPRPLPQTRCACSATTRSWTRRPRRAWRPSAQTAAPSTTRRRSRCSTSTRSSERGGTGGRERWRADDCARSMEMEWNGWALQVLYAGWRACTWAPADRCCRAAAPPRHPARLEEQKRKLKEKDRPAKSASGRGISRANLQARGGRGGPWTAAAPAAGWCRSRCQAAAMVLSWRVAAAAGHAGGARQAAAGAAHAAARGGAVLCWRDVSLHRPRVQRCCRTSGWCSPTSCMRWGCPWTSAQRCVRGSAAGGGGSSCLGGAARDTHNFAPRCACMP